MHQMIAAHWWGDAAAQEPHVSTWTVQEGLGIAAEHGYFFRAAGASGWESLHDGEDGAVHAWREMVLPILQVPKP